MLKILIADDESIERRYLADLFGKHADQFQVVGEAKNGKEIVALAVQLKPDIIIMDINMPLLNGLDSARAIKRQFPDMLILLNTAYAEFEFARRAVDYDLDAYLLKPAEEMQILTTIQNCLRKRKARNKIPSEHVKKLAGTHSNTSQDAVATVKDYVDEHFHMPLNLQSLADSVHFTPSYLSRLFHQTMGVTLKTYITLKRMENAKYLLENSEMSIQEISANCGFSNVSHFNRVFKQQTGLSPLEFRHRCL